MGTTLQTQARPAIELVSGKEGLRLQFWPIDDMLYDVTGTRTLQVRLLGHPEDRNRPWPFGGRGEMAMAVASSARLAFLRGAICAFTPYIRCCHFDICSPLFLVQ